MEKYIQQYNVKLGKISQQIDVAGKDDEIEFDGVYFSTGDIFICFDYILSGTPIDPEYVSLTIFFQWRKT